MRVKRKARGRGAERAPCPPPLATVSASCSPIKRNRAQVFQTEDAFNKTTFLKIPKAFKSTAEHFFW